MLSMLKGKKGFTLIELMIVVAIIGILAAIAIPNFLKFQAKSKQSEAKTNLAGIFTAQTAYFGEQNTYGNFTDINWTPSGSPRYRYTLDGGTSVDNTLTVGANTTIATPVWTGANLNHVKEADGTTDVAPHTPYIDNTTGNAFTVGAAGMISTSANSDCWSINQLKQLVWTQDGI
jgi:type IV pilus assembly protein PilA